MTTKYLNWKKIFEWTQNRQKPRQKKPFMHRSFDANQFWFIFVYIFYFDVRFFVVNACWCVVCRKEPQKNRFWWQWIFFPTLASAKYTKNRNKTKKRADWKITNQNDSNNFLCIFVSLIFVIAFYCIRKSDIIQCVYGYWSFASMGKQSNFLLLLFS